MNKLTMLPMILLIAMPGVGAPAQSLRGQLVGVPVFAADGVKIGQVAAASTNDDGTIDKIRIFTASSLGFGPREVSIPQSAFVIGSDWVRLPHFTSDEIDSLPTAASEARGPGSVER
jgi:hypothetical protein